MTRARFRKTNLWVAVAAAALGVAWLIWPRREIERRDGRIVREPVQPVAIVGELPTPRAKETIPSATPLPLDERVRAELAQDECELEAELNELERRVGQEIQQLGNTASPAALPEEGLGSVTEVVRELDFSGWESQIVQAVMNRYGLRIQRRYVANFNRATFIGKADMGQGRSFVADPRSTPGFYEVFELTPQAVARMSRLEEEALRQRGMDPLRARVRRVVFGITPQAEGGYDLGVISMDAAPVP